MVALSKVPKRNRRSERIETLRERGYSEQELAATERLDRNNLLLFLVTLAALLLAAGLYGWYIFANPAGVTDDDPIVASGEEPASTDGTGTVADFLRSIPSEADEADTDTKIDVDGLPEPLNPAKSAGIDTAPGSIILPGPVSAKPFVAAQYMGPDKSAVRRTTVRALKSGKTKIWKHDGERGYVLVSGKTAYADRTCRHVSYTMIPEIGDQVSSPPVQWCETKRGDWKEDPYTGR